MGKYFEMAPRQRKYELRNSLWSKPLLYVLAAGILALITIFIDLWIDLSGRIGFFTFTYDTTQLLMSTLIGSVLLLSAFTLNILLVVLTTFSGQYSPRMLQDFVADKQTQHFVGAFNGNFIYILIMFLFINNYQKEQFFLVPLVTILLTLVSALIFLFFINHSIYWMQVHNVTNRMRGQSEAILETAVKEDMEELKVEKTGDLLESYRQDAIVVAAAQSGYIQLVDFHGMVEEAEKDEIIIELHERIGNFLLTGNPLFSYWGPGAAAVDEDKYSTFILFGNKELEIQDNNFAMSKLAELAVTSMGNGDPRSAISAIYQLANLMQTIESKIQFVPYLGGKDKQVRVITQQQHFDDALYRGFGMIRHYAKDDLPIIMEIISTLRMLADSSSAEFHEPIWGFAANTIANVSQDIIYDIDRDLLLTRLHQLAAATGHESEYEVLKEQVEGQN
ncbi:hypothetical protein B0X71_08560 [Planococcus lenghuensis]|uniref:DUF2254 domain-containing protein n=2 Tax=Planococcus lenghuensis TaxID=2213202 RepID=A0A1Q2L3L6_9BACL|nr:hypothetical protein B0X71_08560 [Planococcus lenghuensis]